MKKMWSWLNRNLALTLLVAVIVLVMAMSVTMAIVGQQERTACRARGGIPKTFDHEVVCFKPELLK